MVFSGSRYEGSFYTAIVGTDGITRKFLHFRLNPTTMAEIDPSWKQYNFKNRDELDLISFKYGNSVDGKEKLWWLIADVNNILFPLQITTGTPLVIPQKEITAKQV